MHFQSPIIIKFIKENVDYETQIEEALFIREKLKGLIEKKDPIKEWKTTIQEEFDKVKRQISEDNKVENQIQHV